MSKNVPEKQKTAMSKNVPEKQKTAMSINIPEKQKTTMSKNVPEKQKTAMSINIPEKQKSKKRSRDNEEEQEMRLFKKPRKNPSNSSAAADKNQHRPSSSNTQKSTTAKQSTNKPSSSKAKPLKKVAVSPAVSDKKPRKPRSGRKGKYDKFISKDAVPENKKVYSIKMKLRTFLRPEIYNRFHGVIVATVDYVTQLTRELSLFCHFYFRKLVEAGEFEFFQNLTAPKLKMLLQAVEGKTELVEKRDQHLIDAHNEFQAMKKKAKLDKFTTRHTTHSYFIVQEAFNMFETNFKNNIVLHMRSRVRKCVVRLSGLTKKNKIKELTESILEGKVANPNICDMLLPKDWEKKPYKAVPHLFKMQQNLVAADQKSFIVVPISNASRHHIRLPFCALIELCLRNGEKGLRAENSSEDTVRALFMRFADITRFEKKETDKFLSFMTDGESCSVVIKRDLPAASPKSAAPAPASIQAPSVTPDVVVAIDPGYKVVVAGIARPVTKDFWENPTFMPGTKETESNFKLSAKEWHHRTGFHQRKQRHQKITGELESDMAVAREYIGNIGPKSVDYKTFVQFELDWMKEKLRVYANKILDNIRFESFVRRKMIASEVAKQHCPAGANTFIFFGTGGKIGNGIKGHVRGNCKFIVQAMKNLPGVTVFPTGEHYTSQCCSFCSSMMKTSTDRKDRSKHCTSCDEGKKGIDRDINAARNILAKGMKQHFGKNIHKNLIYGRNAGNH